MKRLLLTLAIAILFCGASTAQTADSKYFVHTSNTHLRGKLRLWNESNKSDIYVSHGLGTEIFNNTYGPGRSYANTIGHKFYVHGNETVAQFGIGGNNTPANRLTSRVNGVMGINTTIMPGSASFTVRGRYTSGYGGMSVDVAGNGTNLLPFYSYATNGSVRAWHYFDERDDTWKLYNRGIHFIVKSDGSVGIGTLNPGAYKLAVDGKVRAKEIVVDTGWSDFVFEEGYDLPTLAEVEAHIRAKGHLKDIPSAQDVAEQGVSLGEMDSKLLQKIEELTLYTLQQEKDIDLLHKENQSLKVIAKELAALRAEMDELRSGK